MGPFGVVHSPKNTAICAKCAKDRPPTPSFSYMSNLVTMAANWEPTWSQQGKLLRHSSSFLFGAGTVALSVCLSVCGHVECLLFVYISLNMPSGKFVSKMHTTNTYKQISIKHANADSAEK